VARSEPTEGSKANMRPHDQTPREARVNEPLAPEARGAARTPTGPITSSNHPSPSIKTTDSERSRPVSDIPRCVGRTSWHESLLPILNCEGTPRPDRIFPIKSQAASDAMDELPAMSDATVWKMCRRTAKISRWIYPPHRGIGHSWKVAVRGATTERASRVEKGASLTARNWSAAIPHA